MKSTRLIIVACLVLEQATPSIAGLRFGLGNAVAKRGAELINKAGAADLANATGDTVAQSLPSCTSGAVYDAYPTDLSQIAAIDPLGHVAPSPHTFPSDHIYYYLKAGTVSPAPVYSPGNVHITRVTSSTVLTASPVYTDYGIYFYPCKELKSYYAHVKVLSASLQVQVGAIDQNCMTYTTGGTFHSCEKNVNFTVSSGDLLGYTGTTGALDFGSYDYRQTPLAFVSPARHTGDQPYTVCPIDYFTPGLKTAMDAMLGKFDGTHPRVALPLCGQIMFDVAGTAKGDWYFPGAPDVPEDPHLALIDNNVTAPQETISIGDSLPNQPQSFYPFDPASSGFVDRDFAQVTSDGHIYCYDNFHDFSGAWGGGFIFIIQMPTPSTLKIEQQTAADCSAGSWSFTSNAVTFQR